jgi:uncharacterized BrkB/YihY/UPF0761 family membrane protein
MNETPRNYEAEPSLETQTTEPAPLAPGERGGAVARATAWGMAQYSRAESWRPEHASVEIAFRWYERDKRIAGGVLGGGLAYRFFFWLLSLAVLLSSGLGFASRSGKNVGAATQDVGLGEAVADTVSDAASQSESGRWWLLVVGIWLLLWFSYGLYRALRLVHAAAWWLPPAPARRLPTAIAAVIGITVSVIVLSAGAGWVREHVGVVAGAFATLAFLAGVGVLWVWASGKLLSVKLPWTAFLPGAALVALGLEGIHLFTVLFLAEKLASASSLYGALGLAATLLFYLFMLGRIVVWAAELNAVTWQVRHPAAQVWSVQQQVRMPGTL